MSGATNAVVAGVAALVLSKYPLLTQLQVFDYLTLFADKVGNYTYTEGDYPYTKGRCNEMGYGRVNAYNSLAWCSKSIVQDRVFSVDEEVYNCSIAVQKVSVTNNSNLSLISWGGGDISINAPFEVKLGSSLSVQY